MNLESIVFRNAFQDLSSGRSPSMEKGGEGIQLSLQVGQKKLPKTHIFEQHSWSEF